MRRWVIVSLLLNALMLSAAAAIIVYKGGWSWLEGFICPAQSARFSQSTLYQGRVDAFQATPALSGAWVFLGDSLTDYAPTQEFFGVQALNRGIAGDLVADIARRAPKVSRHTPSAIVLWGGTNDLLAGLGCDDVVRQTLNLPKGLKQSSPQARLIVLGPPPVATRLAENPRGFRAAIDCVNRKLEERITEVDAFFGNSATVLAESSGDLKTLYTFDGVHINSEGYRVWSAWLLPMLTR